MGQVAGYYFAAIYPALAIMFSLLIYIRRNHYFIKCRNPWLLIAQNLGSIISFEIFALYLAMRMDFACSIFFVGCDFMFSCFAVPMLLRCWEYCVNFHISLLKLHYRSSFFMDWRKSSWFFEHKFVASPKFLRKLLIVLMFVITLPSFLAAVPNEFQYNTTTSQGCAVNTVFYIGIAGGLVLIGIAVGMGFLIFRARDVYRIKNEIKILASVWMAAVIVFIAYSSEPRTEQRTFPSPWILIISFTLTLFICNALPLIYAHRFDKHLRRSEGRGSMALFVSLLESVHFRNAFHDFLTKQFCQENLQFYEVVMEWKAIRAGDPIKVEKARAILAVFIAETGVCQVNISSQVRDKISVDIEKEEIPLTIFDEALEALIKDMHVNSFHMYRSLTSLHVAKELSSDSTSA